MNVIIIFNRETKSSDPDNNIKIDKLKLENDSLSEDSYNDDEPDNFEWSEEENENGEFKNHKSHMNPQGLSNKNMNYQSVDKLFTKFVGKINVDKYDLSNLDGGDRFN